MSAARLLPPLVLSASALAAACGAEPAPAPKPFEAPSAARPATPAAPREDPAETARREALDAAMQRAREALRGDDAAEALRLAKEAAALPGAGGEVRALLAAAEKRRDEALRDEARELRGRLAASIDTDHPEARATELEARAAAAAAFVDAHPEAAASVELGAAASHASAEARRHRVFVDAMTRGYASLEGGRAEEALAYAREAFDALPRAEARDLRERALARAAPPGMVYIPGGPAVIGRARVDVPVEGFYLDRTEVTCEQYARFLAETKHPPPPLWVGSSPPMGRLKHPVTNVTPEDAEAFAKWAGKRLPTDYEWEKAARGPNGFTYPWGDTWEAGRANVGRQGTVTAGAAEGDLSPWGVADMAGNVSEYTKPVKPFPPSALPDPPGMEPRWAAKGGAWGGDLKPESLALYLSLRIRPGERGEAFGFRCAKELPAR